jgi:hypothetical protein
MKKLLLSVFVALLSLSAAFAQLPAGYVSINSLAAETDRCPVVVSAGQQFQVAGYSLGWGAATSYDMSAYKQIVIKMSYDAADAGKQVAIRYSINGLGAKDPIVISLPEPSTTYTAYINIDQYKVDGVVTLGGLIIYNGASHWSFTYSGTPSDIDLNVDYVALTADAPSALISTRADNPNALINVYNLTGNLVRKNIMASEAIKGLKPGVYIVNNKKVCVVNN